MTHVPLTRFGLACAVAFGFFLAVTALAAFAGSRWAILSGLLAFLTGWRARIDMREASA